MNKIKLEHDIQVSVIWYNNLDSRSFKSFSQPKWSELVNRLAIPQNNINKYARGVAIYGDMKDGANDHGEIIKKHRNDKNVIYRNVIVLDYDEINDLKQLHEAISSVLSSVAWYWHTSFSHRTEQARIRLYIPLNEHISADEYRKYTKVLASKIGHPVDEGSYQPSRAMALPVKKSNDSIYIFKYNDAPILSVETLEEWSKELKSQYKESNKFKYPKRRDNEFWKSIAFGVSTGNRNQMLTSLIGVLLNRRVPDPLVYAYCFMWNENCNPPLSSREFNATFESIYKREHR
ncbi:TPA: primase alpha helix C-terminal domain-containing protein [Staphylococcus aureus]|nr:primase alpha helix C-terminal domain-containing protein [Staphylococcus aureus]